MGGRWVVYRFRKEHISLLELKAIDGVGKEFLNWPHCEIYNANCPLFTSPPLGTTLIVFAQFLRAFTAFVGARTSGNRNKTLSGIKFDAYICTFVSQAGITCT